MSNTNNIQEERLREWFMENHWLACDCDLEGGENHCKFLPLFEEIKSLITSLTESHIKKIEELDWAAFPQLYDNTKWIKLQDALNIIKGI